MKHKGKLLTGITLASAVTGACLIWALSGLEMVVLDEQLAQGDSITAGPLNHSSRIEQVVKLPDETIPEVIYLGIRFATFGQKNTGQILVKLLQGGTVHTHKIWAEDLLDNEIVYVPFESLKQVPTILSIECLGGTLTRSATVWCHYSPDTDPMTLNGQLSDRRVDIWIAEKVPNRIFIMSRIGMAGLLFISGIFASLLSLQFYGGWVYFSSKKRTTHIHSEFIADASRGLAIKALPFSLVAGILVSGIVYIVTEPAIDYISLDDTFSNDQTHLGPLIEGSEVVQEIEITPEMAYDSLGLGIKFGTYKRSNRAKIAVSLQQGDHLQKQIFNSKKLKDGQEERFLFSGFQAGSAIFKMSGLKGKGSDSPTAWAVQAGENPKLKIGGEEHPLQLVVYRYLVIEKRTGFGPTLGRYPVRWFLSVSTSVFFLSLLRIRKKP